MHESTETIMKLYLTFHNRTLSRKGFEYRIDANRNTSSYSIFKYQSFTKQLFNYLITVSSIWLFSQLTPSKERIKSPFFLPFSIHLNDSRLFATIHTFLLSIEHCNQVEDIFERPPNYVIFPCASLQQKDEEAAETMAKIEAFILSESKLFPPSPLFILPSPLAPLLLLLSPLIPTIYNNITNDGMWEVSDHEGEGKCFDLTQREIWSLHRW